LPDERTQYDELAELAVMSALAAGLRQWQSVAIHSAVLAGACPESVAGAFGGTVQATFNRWYGWALRQRDFIVGDQPGITEFETVERRFSAIGSASVRVAL
jgi:hypothetical protein